MKKITALILTCILLFALSSCAPAAAVNNTPADTPAVESTASAAPGSRIRDANPELVPAYTHYDPAGVLKECETLKNADWTGKETQALALYDELLAEIKKIDTNTSVISIEHDEDLTDETAEAEYIYSDNMTREVLDAFLTAAHALTEGPCSEALKNHIRPVDYEYLQKYLPMTDEEEQIDDRLTELEIEYDELITGGLYELRATAGDREYSFKDLNRENITEELDMDQLLELYLDLAGQLNRKAGEIYLEMVPLRNRKAELNGYSNFAEYADREWYGRDFGTAEAAGYCSTVREFLRDRGQNLDLPDLSETEVAAASVPEYAAKVIGGISGTLDKSLEYLQTNRLHSIGNEDTRVSGGYTVRLENVPGNAFIYLYTEGTAYDVTSLVHELGHFANDHISESPDFYSVQFEVAEIHSTGLQMLAAERYGQAFGEGSAKDIRTYQLCEALLSVQQGCLYDEWQRYIYTHPGMTLEEINERFRQLSLDYGVTKASGMEYDWMYVPHNFSSPMYYISYSVSAVAALELWLKAQTDYAGAVEAWENCLKAGDPFSYTETMKATGLSSVTDADAVNRILTQSYDCYIDLAYSFDFSLPEIAGNFAQIVTQLRLYR